MDTMSYLKDFNERIENNDYPGFLKIWEEYCYSDEPDGKEIIKILNTVKDSELKTPFGRHVERVLSLYREMQDLELAEEVLRLILDLQTTNSEDLADLATEFIQKKYPNDPLIFVDCWNLYDKEKINKFGNIIYSSVGLY